MGRPQDRHAHAIRKSRLRQRRTASTVAEFDGSDVGRGHRDRRVVPFTAPQLVPSLITSVVAVGSGAQPPVMSVRKISRMHHPASAPVRLGDTRTNTESRAPWRSGATGVAGSGGMWSGPAGAPASPLREQQPSRERGDAGGSESDRQPSEDDVPARGGGPPRSRPGEAPTAPGSRSWADRPAASRMGPGDRRAQMREHPQPLGRPAPPATTSHASPLRVAVSSPLKSPGPLKNPACPGTGSRPGIAAGDEPGWAASSSTAASKGHLPR